MLLSKAERLFFMSDEHLSSANYEKVILHRVFRKIEKLEEELAILVHSELFKDAEQSSRSSNDALFRIYKMLIEKVDKPVIALTKDAEDYIKSIQELREQSYKEKISDEQIIEKALKRYFAIIED
ncbi:hypothetical protein NEF87_001331 [Candidatus Lokiarchaeum ossiferum]|uniref:Uncharacterized protein n=1 Tax=Candidatus Lokiarchaeum ossiferum TaxID=2951803 RepID=A0ABY6HR59_9ARCH|nr:hypothetical protein NEF87_001331 [Candidatus Lokiarchaeum sp. B-35]